MLLAQFHLVGERTPEVEPHARFLLPAVLLALEIIVKEALLKIHPVFEIEPLLVPARMRFEPFLLGRRLRVGLEVSARMQAEARPASALRKGTFTFDQSGERERYQSSSISRARKFESVSARLSLSSSFESVAGPVERVSIQWSRGPLGLPCCTASTWRGYQISMNLFERMPPWCAQSR